MDPALYASLVAALFGGRRSLIGASVVALLVCGAAYLAQADHAYLGFAAAFAVVAAFRIQASRQFERTPPPPSPESLWPWELRALCGAWSFAVVTGGLAAYSVVVHAGRPVELLTSCCAFGYIAGISSRNASRPLITIGQISAIAVPFVLGLTTRPDLVHGALAAFVISLFASTVVMARSIHETIVQRHIAHAELEQAALFDPLTGFKNRAPFIGLVNELGRQIRDGDHLALIAIDLDRFKAINDRLGHPAGDLVLVEAARRISEAVGQPHEAARVGGDEFLVAVPAVTREAAAAIAERIRDSLSRDFTARTTIVTCGGSIGVALGPECGQDYDTLMRSADLALYAAKKAGRGRTNFYTAELGAEFDARAEMEENLRWAIARGELSLAYQPVVRCATGRVVGCEALMRWHRNGNAISPAEFIPVAEATGMIVEMGRWALETACREAAGWSGGQRVSVNLSPLQFALDSELIAHVRGALARSGLAANRLELEVTESLLINDVEGAARIIDGLRALGVGVALDDFGTGYSSLGYLKDLRFTKVKMDRRLCRGIHRSPRSRSVVRCVVQLARDLGLEVVAEGIEEPDELSLVRELGVADVQGFIYARPLSASHVAHLLTDPVLRPRLPRAERDGVGGLDAPAEPRLRSALP